jgi:hypothetical protein
MLKLATLAGAGWMTPVAGLLARAAEQETDPRRKKSVILLWLGGGPSQLETFDPHPGKRIAGDTKAIDCALPGVQLAQGMERVAAEMGSITVVRNVVTKEGDHERGSYLVKTGYTPLPVLVHPSLGAVYCHELLEGSGGVPQTEIPEHIAILPGGFPGRGGFLGDKFDAFKVYDPANPVPDVEARVPADRAARRLADLDVVERAFAARRGTRVEKNTLHRHSISAAQRMMSSEQLKAFDISQEPQALRDEYGDSGFGRGCLAARRLVEVGVPCIEVTLDGWDSHINNDSIQTERVKDLDPAFATLVRDLRERQLLERTIVICAGEFGRTPTINPAGGRDHWPAGFSIAMAGGGIRGGLVLGETDPEGGQLKPEQGRRIADIHATILTALELDPAKENLAPGPRPLKLSEGSPIAELLA